MEDQVAIKGWKACTCQSAATPIAKYYMQCQALPSKVCDAVDKTVRDFL